MVRSSEAFWCCARLHGKLVPVKGEDFSPQRDSKEQTDWQRKINKATGGQ